MKKYQYRHPRFPVDLPIKFITPSLTLAARCKEISEDGMRLEMLQPLQLNTFGKVSLRHRDQTLEFNVRVASVGAAHAGLEFVCASLDERCQITQLVASVEAPQHSLVPLLVRGRK